MLKRPTFREYLKLWFKHYKDPITTLIYLFFRPYRYRWAWRKLKDAIEEKQCKPSKWQVFFLSLLESAIVIVPILAALYFLQSEFDLLPFINLKKFALGAVLGGVLLVALGAAEDLAWSVAWGVAFGVAFGVLVAVAGDVTGAMVLGVAWVMAFGVTEGVASGVAWAVAFGVLMGMAFMTLGVLVVVAGDVLVGVAMGLSILVIITRTFDWILWSLAVWIALLFGKKTPLSKFNGYIVFPIFGDHKLLYRKLKADFVEGLEDGFEIAYNPFQRWIFQKGLKRYLSELTPSELLKLFRDIRPGFKNGLWNLPAVPAIEEKFIGKEIPRLRGVLLLLSSKTPEDFKRAERNPFNFVPEGSELWAIRLTSSLMDRSDSLVTDIATAYHAMIFEDERPKNYLYAFYRAKNEGAVGADKLIWTYETIDKCLNCKNVTHIAGIIPELEKFGGLQQQFQPEVVEAFGFLRDIAVDARALHFATARVSWQEAGASALGKLEKLKSYVDEKLPEPERRYFLEIAELWRRLITEEAYELVERRKLEVIANPYPVGQPVTGYAFKGREYIFEEIKSHWNKSQDSFVAILLYGHRRMGKTSIALNLTERHLGSGYIPVYSSAQGHGSSEAEILRHIARAFADKLRIKIPSLEVFSRMPRAAFDDVLGEAKLKRNGRFVIMVIDEFEEIEEGMRNGKIPVDFVNYLRNISQENAEWLGIMLVGSHRLEEMTHEYWNPFWGSIQPIKVGFMDYDEARKLITNPTEGDFPVKYEEEVIERLIQLTGGQPFLVNKVCHAMVDELNRRVVKGEFTRYPTLDTEYLKIALNEVVPDRTNYYFHAVWTQIGEDERRVARALSDLMLRRMKVSPEKLLQIASDVRSEGIVQPCIGFDELRRALGWDERRLEDALRELAIHDVVKPMDDECKPLGCRDISLSKDKPFPKDACLCFCVPLTLPWLSINRLV